MPGIARVTNTAVNTGVQIGTRVYEPWTRVMWTERKSELDGCIVWNAHNTVFGLKRSAYGGTQRPPKSRNTNRFWDRNGFLIQKRHFVELDRKIAEFNIVPKVKL